MDEEPRWLRAEQVAEMLGIARTRVYELMASGAIKSIKLGRNRRVEVGEVTAFIERLRSTGGGDDGRVL